MRDQTILGINDLAFAIHSEAFREGFSAPIALTDAQLAAVFSAARPLAVASGDAFLLDLAAALRGQENLGDGTVGREGRPVGMGRLVVLGPGDALTVSAATKQESRSPTLDVLILGGRPIREPVAWLGPFVMNTRDEVLQAVADYQAGRLGSIPAVHNTPSHLIQTASSGPDA